MNNETIREGIHHLSLLTLNPSAAAESLEHVTRLGDLRRRQFLSLADSHHVVIRALESLRLRAANSARTEIIAWADAAMERERVRIDNALAHLAKIVRELEDTGCAVTVMKSLDHYPDLGNDLDLYTTTGDRAVVQAFRAKFRARVEPRSWGDRLAHKWNFAIEGLPEAVEVHVRRLGQAGEHVAMARRFVTRRVYRDVAGYRFPVPAPEERVVVATLQRVYRHFYFRVCDMVNTAALVDSGVVDFEELRRSAGLGQVWPGVATFLVVVSDYCKRYRGSGLELPQMVRSAALFGGDKVFVGGKFIRVPIMPFGASLYGKQVTSTALRGNVPATFRLSLLPPLASAAAIAYRITGSDKGIW